MFASSCELNIVILFDASAATASNSAGASTSLNLAMPQHALASPRGCHWFDSFLMLEAALSTNLCRIGREALSKVRHRAPRRWSAVAKLTWLNTPPLDSKRERTSAAVSQEMISLLSAIAAFLLPGRSDEEFGPLSAVNLTPMRLSPIIEPSMAMRAASHSLGSTVIKAMLRGWPVTASFGIRTPRTTHTPSKKLRTDSTVDPRGRLCTKSSALAGGPTLPAAGAAVAATRSTSCSPPSRESASRCAGASKCAAAASSRAEAAAESAARSRPSSRLK
mmetsp:Transcript_24525/g.82559  ORF Transcript_24525/g.82559 Transcript_24525/m.82559 type:complete len:277 (+) Transcript_24525:86-916(+)